MNHSDRLACHFVALELPNGVGKSPKWSPKGCQEASAGVENGTKCNALFVKAEKVRSMLKFWLLGAAFWGPCGHQFGMFFRLIF